MAKPRKFWKTIIEVEVLSEDSPYDLNDLNDLGHLYEDIMTGGCSGVSEVIRTEEMDGAACAKALQAQGSDPGFFQIDADGKEIEE